MTLHWAEQVLQGNLGLRTGEVVVVVVDRPLEGAARSLAAAARELGAGGVRLLRLPSPGSRLSVVSSQMVREVAAADVVVVLLSRFDLGEEMHALRAAMAAFRKEGRGRWVLGAGLDEPLLAAMTVGDVQAVAASVRSLAAKLEGSVGVRIVTEAGTDLTLSWAGRSFHLETGLLREPGAVGNLPAGEVYIAPLEESAEGRLVVDLSLGDIDLDRPVVLTFHHGRVVHLEGGQAARTLLERLGSGPWAWTVGEFGIGANPYVPVRGLASIDEKVLGTVHIALGGNRRFGGVNRASSHYDMVINRPQLLLERETGEAPSIFSPGSA